ncbi:MAG TPA: GNAT family N-acetyltransferase [Nitrosopumilaceae archaeon]|nr:GNAT family N-acetyltransferase [Nitrosopumilaceae archaeon]
MKISEWLDEESEKEGILALTQKVFGEQEITQPSYFDWQYRINPQGKALILLAKDESKNEKIIGTNVLIPINLIIEKKAIRSSLACNVQVDPTYRGQGIFSKLLGSMKEYAEKNGVLYFYAVPNKKSFNAFIRQGAVKITSLPILVRPLNFSKFFNSPLQRIFKLFDWMWKINSVENSKINLFTDDFSEEFETFSNKATQRIPIMVKRDVSFFRWRYHSCPTRKYKIFTLKEDSQLKGYIITRITKFEEKTIGVIVDFLVDDEIRDKKSLKDLVNTALLDLIHNGASVAIATCNKRFLESTILHETRFFSVPNSFKPQQLNFISSSFTQDEYVKKLANYDNWFFSFGDYDIF